jgi:menaquinone-dependent protoporphyrinogen oxidase
MKNKILVTYASKHGATEELAVRIGDYISNHGFDVDVLNVKNVRNISAYQSIILGSAVYVGQWRKSAANFLKENETALAKKKVWLFSTGPTGEGDPEELMKGWSFPENLQAVVDKIKPVEIKVFHGVLDETKLNMLEKMTVKMVKAPFGDFRDWNKVEEWAKTITNQLGDLQNQ